MSKAQEKARARNWALFQLKGARAALLNVKGHQFTRLQQQCLTSAANAITQCLQDMQTTEQDND